MQQHFSHATGDNVLRKLMTLAFKTKGTASILYKYTTCFKFHALTVNRKNKTEVGREYANNSTQRKGCSMR